MSLMTPERIRELSAEARSNVETKANDRGDARDTCDTRWWHPDHFDQEFARLIIQEVGGHPVKLHSVKPLPTSLRIELIGNWFAEEALQDKALGLLWDYDSMIGIRKEGE